MTQLFTSRRVLTPTGLRPATLVVEGEHILALLDGHRAALPPGLGAEVAWQDHGDLLICPGIVDTHVHINEPGRTEWEGFATATEAAAAGGITTLVDMPLNCIPPTISLEAARVKAEALAGQAHVDVAFWGGVVPGNQGEFRAMARAGITGAKCFLCPSGVDEFPHVGEAELRPALRALVEQGMRLLVHAEAPGPLERAEAEQASRDPRSYATYLASRPPSAEEEAIAMVIRLVRETGCPAHIVHLASAGALPLLQQAQEEGLPISAETCLHYLSFSAEQIGAGQTWFKCAPPIREEAHQRGLWGGLERGVVGMVVSDHSPCTPALKKIEQGDFMGAWGGIAGLQLGLSALWTEASRRGHSLEQVFTWNAARTADLAGLGGRKGQLSPGAEADLVIWDDHKQRRLGSEELRHRHRLSPYVGREFSGEVHQTWVRGQLAYDAREGLRAPVGRLLQPALLA